MFTIFSIIFSFLTIIQPWPAAAYFGAGRVAAQFSWQVGEWVLREPEFAVVAPDGSGYDVTEVVQNGHFSEGLDNWTTTGAVTIQNSSQCGGQQTTVRVGSLPDETQTVRNENTLSQTLPTSNAQYLLVRYCLVSWETLPLFDEPALQITVGEDIVWEDAPTISAQNAEQPFSSGWRTALIQLPAESTSVPLTITAGNTVDPQHPTIAYVAEISTGIAFGVNGTAVELTTAPAIRHIQIMLNQELLHQEQTQDNSTISLHLPTLAPGWHTVQVIQENILIQQKITKYHLFVPGLSPVIPTIWLELSDPDNTVTAYFTAPSDFLGNKLVRYEVIQKTADGTIHQITDFNHSFIWLSPRIPGSQEYLTFPYDPQSSYAIKVIDQFGTGSTTDWLTVQE